MKTTAGGFLIHAEGDGDTLGFALSFVLTDVVRVLSDRGFEGFCDWQHTLRSAYIIVVMVG
jgi:hypothetical protein